MLRFKYKKKSIINRKKNDQIGKNVRRVRKLSKNANKITKISSKNIQKTSKTIKNTTNIKKYKKNIKKILNFSSLYDWNEYNYNPEHGQTSYALPKHHQRILHHMESQEPGGFVEHPDEIDDDAYHAPEENIFDFYKEDGRTATLNDYFHADKKGKILREHDAWQHLKRENNLQKAYSVAEATNAFFPGQHHRDIQDEVLELEEKIAGRVGNEGTSALSAPKIEPEEILDSHNHQNFLKHSTKIHGSLMETPLFDEFSAREMAKQEAKSGGVHSLDEDTHDRVEEVLNKRKTYYRWLSGKRFEHQLKIMEPLKVIVPRIYENLTNRLVLLHKLKILQHVLQVNDKKLDKKVKEQRQNDLKRLDLEISQIENNPNFSTEQPKAFGEKELHISDPVEYWCDELVEDAKQSPQDFDKVVSSIVDEKVGGSIDNLFDKVKVQQQKGNLDELKQQMNMFGNFSDFKKDDTLLTKEEKEDLAKQHALNEEMAEKTSHLSAREIRKAFEGKIDENDLEIPEDNLNISFDELNLSEEDEMFNKYLSTIRQLEELESEELVFQQHSTIAHKREILEARRNMYWDKLLSQQNSNETDIEDPVKRKEMIKKRLQLAIPGLSGPEQKRAISRWADSIDLERLDKNFGPDPSAFDALNAKIKRYEEWKSEEPRSSVEQMNYLVTEEMETDLTHMITSMGMLPSGHGKRTLVSSLLDVDDPPDNPDKFMNIESEGYEFPAEESTQLEVLEKDDGFLDLDLTKDDVNETMKHDEPKDYKKQMESWPQEKYDRVKQIIDDAQDHNDPAKLKRDLRAAVEDPHILKYLFSVPMDKVKYMPQNANSVYEKLFEWVIKAVGSQYSDWDDLKGERISVLKLPLKEKIMDVLRQLELDESPENFLERFDPFARKTRLLDVGHFEALGKRMMMVQGRYEERIARAYENFGITEPIAKRQPLIDMEDMVSRVKVEPEHINHPMNLQFIPRIPKEDRVLSDVLMDVNHFQPRYDYSHWVDKSSMIQCETPVHLVMPYLQYFSGEGSDPHKAIESFRAHCPRGIGQLFMNTVEDVNCMIEKEAGKYNRQYNGMYWNVDRDATINIEHLKKHIDTRDIDTDETRFEALSSKNEDVYDNAAIEFSRLPLKTFAEYVHDLNNGGKLDNVTDDLVFFLKNQIHDIEHLVDSQFSVVKEGVSSVWTDEVVLEEPYNADPKKAKADVIENTGHMNSHDREVSLSLLGNKWIEHSQSKSELEDKIIDKYFKVTAEKKLVTSNTMWFKTFDILVGKFTNATPAKSKKAADEYFKDMEKMIDIGKKIHWTTLNERRRFNESTWYILNLQKQPAKMLKVWKKYTSTPKEGNPLSVKMANLLIQSLCEEGTESNVNEAKNIFNQLSKETYLGLQPDVVTYKLAMDNKLATKEELEENFEDLSPHDIDFRYQLATPREKGDFVDTIYENSIVDRLRKDVEAKRKDHAGYKLQRIVKNIKNQPIHEFLSALDQEKQNLFDKHPILKDLPNFIMPESKDEHLKLI